MSAPNVVEPFAVLDSFITGCDRVEIVGPNLRLRLVVKQRCDDGRTEHAVVAKIVGSVADMREIAREILKADDKSLALLEEVNRQVSMQ